MDAVDHSLQVSGNHGLRVRNHKGDCKLRTKLMEHDIHVAALKEVITNEV